MQTIHAIFAYSVLHEVGSLREEPLTEERMSEVRREVRAFGLPHLVARLVPATDDGVVSEVKADVQVQVVGFAYAAPFRPFGAYRITVEDSIYVAHGHRKTGIGRALLSELLVRLKKVKAAFPTPPAPLSNQASGSGGIDLYTNSDTDMAQKGSHYDRSTEPQSLRNVIAVIGGGDENRGSVALHTALGFKRVGTLTSVGYKFGRWLDVALMQCTLNSNTQ